MSAGAENAAHGSLTRLAPGAVLGRYELVHEIASGGMGRVYLARQRGPAGFEKVVALKTIHTELAEDKSFVDMFLDEARIAARIDHPNVCHVYDFGHEGGTYFLAMEYLAGESLARLGRIAAKGAVKPPLPEDLLIARVIAEAAEGLHAAHELTDERGNLLHVVHRDVSPQNVFVTYDGGVRIVDFGIASAAGRLHHTSTGSVKGKFSYMAPEQMRRDPIDRRADIWALGVVLFEQLTRRKLYKAQNELELILTVLNDPVPRPSEIAPSIRPELEAIVMRALSKDKDLRYATAREMSRDLQRYIVQRAEVVGMAEVADWMASLFPTEKRAKRELLEGARALPPAASVPPAPTTTTVLPQDAAVPVAEVTRERAITPSAARSNTGPHAPPPAPPFAAPAPVSEPIESPAFAPRVSAQDPFASPLSDLERAPAAGSSRKPVLLGAAIAAVAVLGLGGYALTRGPSTTATPTSTPPPAPSPSTSTTATTTTSAAPAGTSAANTVTEPAPTVPPAAPTTTPATTARTTPTAPPATTTSPRPAVTVRAPTGPGTLQVNTTGGWANVYLRGNNLGRTPLEVSLASGQHTLELRPYGLIPLGASSGLRRTVTINAGRTTRIQVPINR